jgi:hypothetical protein
MLGRKWINQAEESILEAVVGSGKHRLAARIWYVVLFNFLLWVLV